MPGQDCTVTGANSILLEGLPIAALAAACLDELAAAGPNEVTRVLEVAACTSCSRTQRLQRVRNWAPWVPGRTRLACLQQKDSVGTFQMQKMLKRGCAHDHAFFRIPARS